MVQRRPCETCNAADRVLAAISLEQEGLCGHELSNLYVVKTPETHGKSCIEDMFPKRWRGKRLNGKSFTAGKVDPSKNYGKEIFAKSVIKPNAGTINFSGFDPLLKRIVKVLDHHMALQLASVVTPTPAQL